MSSQSTEMEYTTLGKFLQETRSKQGLELTDIAEETRISLKNLQAIEEGDFGALPAEAFARGFYTLYARTLSLDPADVLKKFAQERPNQTTSGNRSTTPGQSALDVRSMAERPTSLPFSSFGLILLLLLLFGAFLCWYFSWNPATYLSQKLRGLQEEPQRLEQVLESRTKPDKPEPLFEVARIWKERPTSPTLFDLPSTATAGVVRHDRPENLAPVPVVVGKYSVNAIFKEATELTLAIDDHPQRMLSFKIGQSATWTADEKFIIILPAKTQTKLTLNNIPLDLPNAKKGLVTLTIPGDSLQ